MLRTRSFWESFLSAYIALFGLIWGFVGVYISLEGGQSLRQQLDAYWWILLVLPLPISFLYATLRNVKQETQAQTLNQFNRRGMLNLVENTWVEDYLKNSLHGAALLELGIKEDPDAVKNYSWSIKNAATDETLPVGKSMLEIFEEIGSERSLLILGEPGSGKTTMLLELTSQLIERARRDETEPIPVVFKLASWTGKLTFADWLGEQLVSLYHAPPSLARENQLLLLLDGLDEVEGENYAKCVQAINQFRNEQHGLTSLVVSSRIKEYSAIEKKLEFEGAIALQPLTSQQVSDYIDLFGQSLAGLKESLQKDKDLQELSKTPLMLSIMVLAYKNTKADELPPSNSIEDRRKHLFNMYIDRMFEHRGRSGQALFTKQQTLHYLSWLARAMIRNNSDPYKIESMEPIWLETETQIRLYRLYIRLALILGGWLIGWVGGGPIGAPIGALGAWLCAELFGLIRSATNRITMVDRLKWSWKEAQRGLVKGLLFGLIGGFLSGLIYGLISGLILALGFGLVSDLLGWLFSGLLLGLIGGAIAGLMFGLIFGLSVGVSKGLAPKEVKDTSSPGQRLKQTLLSGLYATLTGGLLGVLLYVLTFGSIIVLIIGLVYFLSGESTLEPLVAEMNDLLRSLLGGEPLVVLITSSSPFGLTAGLTSGFFGGYFPLIQHFALRLALAEHHLLPRKLMAFLRYSVGLIFLRRVGGGYEFVHGLLMDHFASLIPQEGRTKEIFPTTLSPNRKWIITSFLIISIILITLVASMINLYRGIQAQAYSEAISSSSSAEQAYRHALQATNLVSDNADYWNDVCWFGSLSKHAEEVIDACDRAVDLDPNSAYIRDSRGLARALTGDSTGAIEDFTFYVQWAQRPENWSFESADASQRECMIEDLHNGTFDKEVYLNELLLDDGLLSQIRPFAYSCPHGGNGGEAFEDSPPSSAQVVELYIWSGTFVDAVQMIYDTADLPKHGGDGGIEAKITFEPGEYITAISGTSGEFLESLTIETSSGRRFGPFGVPAGTPFEVRPPNGYEIVGFYGRAGVYIDAIGAVIRPH